MDKQTKTVLGRILGEVFRLQKRAAVPTYDEGTIYGLINGIESAIDKVFEESTLVPQSEVDTVAEILQPFFDDPAKLANFKGYYDIEPQLKARGIDRGTAIAILTYFQGRSMYTSVIEKMDSSDSPTECRTFEIRESEV